MDRISYERQFHNQELSNNSRCTIAKYYSIWKSSKEFYLRLITKYSSPKGKSLEYGCGPGSSAFLLAKKGANVTAIDISDVAIRQAKEIALAEGLDIDFRTMNAEELLFGSDTFELVCGSGILHHLDLTRAYEEISRVLKPDGHAVFIEPLGHNPLINLYRRLTPHLRTKDEHPLTMSDLNLATKYFHAIRTKFFHLASLVLIPFRNWSAFDKALDKFDKLDQMLLKGTSPLRRYAWIVVIELSSPTKR